MKLIEPLFDFLANPLNLWLSPRFEDRHAVLKLNCGFGLTTQAPDIAPEVGVLFHF